MKIGIYISTLDGCTLDEAILRVQRAESAGFQTGWLGQLWGFDALTLLALAGPLFIR